MPGEERSEFAVLALPTLPRRGPTLVPLDVSGEQDHHGVSRGSNPRELHRRRSVLFLARDPSMNLNLGVGCLDRFDESSGLMVSLRVNRISKQIIPLLRVLIGPIPHRQPKCCEAFCETLF